MIDSKGIQELAQGLQCITHNSQPHEDYNMTTYKITGVVAMKNRRAKDISETYSSYDEANDRLKDLMIQFDYSNLTIQFEEA